jgi:hypothetical protein
MLLLAAGPNMVLFVTLPERWVMQRPPVVADMVLFEMASPCHDETTSALPPMSVLLVMFPVDDNEYIGVLDIPVPLIMQLSIWMLVFELVSTTVEPLLDTLYPTQSNIMVLALNLMHCSPAAPDVFEMLLKSIPDAESRPQP